MAIFFFSATGIEMLSNFATGIGNVVQVATEEGGEMIGVTLILWPLLDLMAAKLEPARRSSSKLSGPVGRWSARPSLQ